MSNKGAAWVAVGAFAVLAIGVAVWLWMGQAQDVNTSQTPTSQTNNQTGTPSNQAEDNTSPKGVTVNILNSAFDPASIKIKKGQTVTWTNNDSVEHSIVADDSGNTGGLPTDVQLFGQGETFSVTFNKVGTFKYHCIPHTFMRGQVEVTE